MFFLFSPQTEKTNTPTRGQLFSFFKIFTADFSHFLVTKTNVFLSQKSDYSNPPPPQRNATFFTPKTPSGILWGGSIFFFFVPKYKYFLCQVQFL